MVIIFNPDFKLIFSVKKLSFSPELKATSSPLTSTCASGSVFPKTTVKLLLVTELSSGSIISNIGGDIIFYKQKPK